jgi:hypothetical protein
VEQRCRALKLCRGDDSFPPQWQVLLATNGSGERMTFHDAGPNADLAFTASEWITEQAGSGSDLVALILL